MKAGRGSQTAVMVCEARAAADGSGVARFSDPTALALLPDDAKARVQAFHAGLPPAGGGARWRHRILASRAAMMVARTVAIDDVVRAAPSPQLVILGAGLDGRAWRLPELRDTVVFEVDHPDSQRDKKSRAAALKPTAREIRFVAVDFTRDGLDAELQRAGHDPAKPTTWIWEGVVMYLTLQEIEASLSVIQRRSAAGSRLVVAYHAPALLLSLLGFLLRRIGEPLRSQFTADAMRTLLVRFGFEVTQDQGLPEIGAALSAQLGAATRRLGHLRIASATRAGG